MQAFRHSDLTGHALASGWVPGGEVIPTDFTEKSKYFTNKFGHGAKGKKAENIKGSALTKSEASASDDKSKEKPKANDESKEKVKANNENKEKIKDNAKAHESLDKDEASSVSAATTGSNRLKSDDKSSPKGRSGTSSDVSVAGKASLDAVEKSNAPVENDKDSVEKK